MRIHRVIKIFVLLIAVLNMSCALSQHPKKSQDKLKIEIIKGKTTETAILNSLGVPSSITTDSVGNEVWNYQKIDYFTSTNPAENGIVFWEISTGEPNETTDPFDFVITFDHNDVVKDFQIVITPF